MQLTADDVFKLREKNHLTQEKFAEKIGVHHSLVCLMEKGKTPVSRRIAVRIVAAFGLTHDALMELREMPV